MAITLRLELSVVPAGMTCKRTVVPFLPRIISTTLSSFMSTTSTKGSLPCATAAILSSTFNSPWLEAGPPAMSSTILEYSSSLRRIAPMPVSESRMLMEKFSISLGLMYSLCGS